MISDVASSSRHLWRWLRFRVLRLWYFGFIFWRWRRLILGRRVIVFPLSSLPSGADPKGGWGLHPLLLVHQWKYGEGEGEEDVEERRKNREIVEQEISPPSILFCIRHCLPWRKKARVLEARCPKGTTRARSRKHAGGWRNTVAIGFASLGSWLQAWRECRGREEHETHYTTTSSVLNCRYIIFAIYISRHNVYLSA